MVSPSEPASQMSTWHAVAAAEVLSRLGSTSRGLSSTIARARLETAGPNAMPTAPPISRLRVLADQCRSVIALLLLAAGIVAALTGDLTDAAAIAAVLMLNIGIGYVMEIGAHRAVEALASLEARRATAIRDREPQDVDARTVVPGDIIIVEEGQAIPADARLLDAVELRVDEASLTGESVPVSKRADAALEAGAALPDRVNMLYAGTTVATGRAIAVVTATGAGTELGRIGTLVRATRVERTPLERRLDALGRQLVWVALAAGSLVGLLGWWQHLPLADILQTAIALAVAAVPEGLPAVATITLAIGVRRMARRRALVRRLPAVETLGSVTVICTDKTGTLTAAVMQVTRLRTVAREIVVSGDGYEPSGSFHAEGKTLRPRDDADLSAILRVCALASRADAVHAASGWVARGDPTEAALVVAARRGGIERAEVVRTLPEIGEVPFSSQRQLMATFHSDGDRTLAFVKGAPHRVLGLCGSVLQDGTRHVLTVGERQSLLEANQQMAVTGHRVLALAFGEVDVAAEAGLVNLTFAGLAGMNDPPAAGVKHAIETFRTAGIRTVMITGDQKGTAMAVARDLSLAPANALALEGTEVDMLSDDALARRLRTVAVFSRVSPEAKLRIVAAYQRNGEIVAMLGDGVNDAAALKKADVGVTMGGRGTDAARQAAAVVLQDDQFGTIGVAIEEGRVVFDNIRKFVFYLFSCNLAEIVVLLGAGLAGLPPPLLPVQILWLNLVTDTFPALALAAEPAVEDVMQRPPRDPRHDIVYARFARGIVFYGLLIAAPVFMVMWWSTLAAVPPGRAMTMTFMVLSLSQLLHLGNARDTRPVIHPRRVVANRAAIAAVAGTIGLQIATVLSPALRQALHLNVLTGIDWVVVAGVSVIPAVIGQGLKIVNRTRESPQAPRKIPHLLRG